MREVADAEGRVPARAPGDSIGSRRASASSTMLEARGRLVKKEPHQHTVRHCYRCDTVVEPRLSDQWFVRWSRSPSPRSRACATGAIRMLPERG